MPTRKYEQRLRAERTEDTRQRILDAVHHCLTTAPTEPIALDRIAEFARVARSTIYQLFESRAGLLDAYTDQLWERTGLAALTEAVANPDARVHLRAGITASSRMYAADRNTYRVLFSMDLLDPESVGGAVRKREHNRQGGMEYLARRLHEDAQLRDDVSVEEAVDVLWMLCSFESFDLLYTGRGLTLDRSAELLIQTAERTLCVTEPARRPAEQAAAKAGATPRTRVSPRPSRQRR